MTEEQIRRSIEQNRLQLNGWLKFDHYCVVWSILFIPAIFLYFHLKDYWQGKPAPFNKFEMGFIAVTLFLAGVFYYIQHKRLRFKSVKTRLRREQLDSVIEKVAEELKWIPERIDDKVIIAKTHPGFFSGSWGEHITILFDGNRVLVNSICDPEKRCSVLAMGRNKRNERRLLEAIEKPGKRYVRS